MGKLTKSEILGFHAHFNEERRIYFEVLGRHYKRYYTDEQKQYALNQIAEYGIKGTARILLVSRSTLQRWCRKYSIFVARCPLWVYVWARHRKNRKKFWAARGY